MGTTEENRQAVRAVFEQWEHGDSRPFFALVADDVRWTVTGSTGISGTFQSKDAFMTQAAGLLTKRFAGPLVAKLIDVSADDDKVFVQWEGNAVSVTGLAYEQAYCWVLSLRDGRVVEAVAYLDTELVSEVLR